MDVEFFEVAKTGEILPGQTKRVRPFKGEYLLVCNWDGEYHVVEDFCSHDGAILGFGDMDGKYIECPRHAALFDVTCGAAIGAWKNLRALKTYPVRITSDKIEVGIKIYEASANAPSPPNARRRRA